LGEHGSQDIQQLGHRVEREDTKALDQSLAINSSKLVGHDMTMLAIKGARDAKWIAKSA